ncbi:MAG: VWA domain-containing protein [Tetrasphaera sp.]
MTGPVGDQARLGGRDLPLRGGAEILLGFARALRAAGVAVSADRERAYLEAVAAVGLEHPAHVYRAGRATLCGSPADLERHDVVFASWFAGEQGGTKRNPALSRPTSTTDLSGDAGEGAGDDPDVVRAAASTTDVLRHRDVSGLSADEKRQLAALFGQLRPRPPLRRDHRHHPASRGPVDAPRTLRDSLRRMGEPGRIHRRRRGQRSRRVVLLVDISGSMGPYADSLLRLSHAFCRSRMPVEVFTLGTRLTHVTRALAHRDADRALVAVGDAVPDWSGGTRLAEGIKAFLDRWGRRGMARGAVVVIFSDGWERGDPAALGEQLRRLRAVSHAVVWANPHRGRAAYEPVQGGIVAALPHLDHFVAGHSLAAFEELIEVVADA